MLMNFLIIAKLLILRVNKKMILSMKIYLAVKCINYMPMAGMKAYWILVVIQQKNFWHGWMASIKIFQEVVGIHGKLNEVGILHILIFTSCENNMTIKKLSLL